MTRASTACISAGAVRQVVRSPAGRTSAPSRGSRRRRRRRLAASAGETTSRVPIAVLDRHRQTRAGGPPRRRPRRGSGSRGSRRRRTGSCGAGLAESSAPRTCNRPGAARSTGEQEDDAGREEGRPTPGEVARAPPPQGTGWRRRGRSPTVAPTADRRGCPRPPDRVEHQRAWRRCRRRCPPRPRDRSPGRNRRRSHASAGAAGRPGEPRRCRAT